MVPFEFPSPRDTSWLCLASPKLLARVPALAGVGGHMLCYLRLQVLHGGPCKASVRCTATGYSALPKGMRRDLVPCESSPLHARDKTL